LLEIEGNRGLRIRTTQIVPSQSIQMTKTFVFVTDSFYYEFVICDQVARVTKRAFKAHSFNFYDQSTTVSLAKAREYYRQLQAATN
jgi:hypothetical protein